MSNKDRETISETKDGKVQLDRDGSIHISGSEEITLSKLDIANITRINKALKKDDG